MTIIDHPTPTLDFAAILAGLAELGPPSQVRSQGPRMAADALHFDRVLLSTIYKSTLFVETVHIASDDKPSDLAAELHDHQISLGYPLVEGEILRRRRAQVVHVADSESVARYAFADILGWTSYVVAPIVLDGRAIGFLHADRRGDHAEVTELDASNLASFAACFALVYERAILRHRLRVQREEMRQVAGWATARTSELGDRSVTLCEDTDKGAHAGPIAKAPTGKTALRDLLTRREMDVLELMVRGETNAGIAGHLILSEGTVKFHVKNILRKLHASNRGEAISRYLRLTLKNGSPG